MYVAIVPARAGSQRLPGKNTADLGGHPLIAWTIRAALAAETFDQVVVTTDSDQIAERAEAVGATILVRPDHLATAEARSVEVVHHTLEHYPAASFALLQPTSPFRSARHIREATELHSTSGQSVVSVSPSKPLSWNYLIGIDGRLLPAVTERLAESGQQARRIVRPNGGLYIKRVDAFEHDRLLIDTGTHGYLMNIIDGIDIDDPDDLDLARAVAQTGLREIDRPL